MTAHKHAALMAEYAKDALETEEPWLLWEKRCGTYWSRLDRHPVWRVDWEYRRRPRTININGFEVPEPLRVAPAEGTRCWVVALPFEEGCGGPFPWSGLTFDRVRLVRGLIHLTQEAAQLHAQALLSFTDGSKT